MTIAEDKHGKIKFYIDLYIKLIALVAIFALSDSFIQFKPLIGINGLSPVAEFLMSSSAEYGAFAIIRTPTLFWISTSNIFIALVFCVGIVSALLALLGFYRSIGLGMVFICWLSIVNSGGDFFIYIWDTFLLECVFIAFLLALLPREGKYAILSKKFLYFFIFRFWFTMGIEKLLFNNPQWLDGTYMRYYFQNQPMPTKLSYFMSHFNAEVYTILGLMVLVIEIVLPFLIFFRKLRIISFVGFCLISILIQLFGNYAWFNILSIFVSIPLLIDTRLGDFIYQKFNGKKRFAKNTYAFQWKKAIWVVYFQMLIQFSYLFFCFFPMGNRYLNFLNYYQYNQQFMGISNLNLATKVLSYPLYLGADFKIANPYGVFKGIAVKRWELEFVMVNDTITHSGEVVRYKYKPGFVKGSNFFAPHFPRLEQQLFYEAQQGSFYLNYTPTVFWKNRTCWTKRLVDNLLGSGSLVHRPNSEVKYKYVVVNIWQFNYSGWEEYQNDRVVWRKKLIFSFTLDGTSANCPIIEPEVFTKFHKHDIESF